MLAAVVPVAGEAAFCCTGSCVLSLGKFLVGLLARASLGLSVEEVLRSLMPFRNSFGLPFFLFFPLNFHASSSTTGLPLSPRPSAAFSFSSCCFLKAARESAVSFRMASSLARVDSRTDSRKSASSSSMARNWFFRRLAWKRGLVCVETRVYSFVPLQMLLLWRLFARTI